MSSRSNGQLNLPPMPLPKSEQDAAVLTNREQAFAVLPKQEPFTVADAEALSVALINEAIEAAHLTNAQIAFILAVDESLIRKMRNPQNRERMSHVQMLVIGSHCHRFYVELNVALDRRTGWFSSFAWHLQQLAHAFFSMSAGR